ncbi:hypothetical protein H7K09_05640 [Mycolicibacterium duvalii]|uniref:hypothetical protein n=1 Tax=Mycolicibacterium duvalii TaxID=39688 RepID=UPI0021F2F4B1|nr:hypothetical protein [Mycolicibacterium duvalii]MCV7366952.1 hypothetical protein [Mycolicibacterium duvalii]
MTKQKTPKLASKKPPAFVLSQDQTLQTKTFRTNLTKQKTPKLASKKTAPLNGKKKHGKKQQQTKTTKHTIEFSNNTPARPRNQPSAIKPLQVVRTIRNPPQWISLWESAALPGLGPCRGDLE